MGLAEMVRAIFLSIALVMATPAAAQLRAEDGLAALDAGDAVTARSIWAALAEHGDLLAQHNLAVLKLTGQGGDADPEAAQYWFEAAAVEGHLASKLALAGLARERGQSDQAQRWYRAAAQAGDARAQVALAQLLDQQADREGALHWYRAAAKQGVLAAKSALAALLAEAGAHDQATDWFEAAAAQGDLPALHNLAVAVAQGLGRAQDVQTARALYLQAAQAGYAPSMRNLALIQARGEGGAQSFRFALAWALAAQAADDPGARDVVDALRTVMSERAVVAAERLVGMCRTGELVCD